MCGIAGYIKRNADSDVYGKVESMLNTIIHRGPDDFGVEVYDGKIGLGHRRLSIIDLSANGRQPMSYGDNLSITYNGEIYNYKELRDELRSRGYKFSTNTDTEVLLAAYKHWGKECVNRFNGMWSFAIFDQKEGSLFCSRDRYGVKPFYYYQDDEKFIFASEIKEILAAHPELSRGNKERLSAYLTIGMSEFGRETFFESIFQLEGGKNLVFDIKGWDLNEKKYYELRNVRLNSRSSEKESYLGFRNKFMSAVALRLRADVPVGSCLSGGLDSSAIVCAVHTILENRKSDNAQCSVSSCFEEKKYDEQEYIDEVVNHVGITSYKVFPDMSRLLEKLDNIIWHMDEPFGSTSMYAQWCVFEEAHNRGLKIMLDGQGSDEQLAGYTDFYQVLFVDLFKKFKWKRLSKEIKAYRNLREKTEPFSAISMLRSSLVAMMPAWIEKPLHNRWRKARNTPFGDSAYDNKYVQQHYGEYDRSNPQKFIYTELHRGMRELLHYEDRNSMAHSIEARVPFLDWELVEFIYSVPIEHKIKDGRTKNMIREGLKDILPEKIYNRISKLGFVTPEDSWIRGNRDEIRNEVSKACDTLSGIIDKNKVMKWFDGNDFMKKDFTCFRIICAGKWMKLYGVMGIN